MSKRTHPIPKETIRMILRSSERADSELGAMNDEEVLMHHELLSEVQAIFQDHLRSLIGGAYGGTRRTGFTVFWESPHYYLLADESEILRHALSSQLQIESSIAPVAKMHRRTASDLVQDYPDLEPDTEDVWVVAKPESWYGAQWTLDRFFTHLLERGVSPTQALDYWMVNVLEKRPIQWAQTRGTTGQTIRDSLRTAEDQLAESTESTSDCEYAPFERTYSVRHTDETTDVIVDGHILYPRRDIFTYASSGKLTWGYRGAGVSQLAVALLADVLETDDLPFAALDEFVGFLNSELGAGDDWTLTEDRIRAWVHARTDYFD